jgi:hypothetical protein
MRTATRASTIVAVLLLWMGSTPRAALRVETLRSTGGLPPHIAGLFEEPLGFQQTPGGPYYVFDRRAHTVYTVDAEKTSARKLVEIGQEQGRILQPRGFDVRPDGSFVIADAPRSQERVQIFGPAGIRTQGFFLPGRPTPAVIAGSLVLSGIASIKFSGERLLVSHPESDALFTEYSAGGWALRSFGRLRDTGFEQDRELHLALNAGLPLVDPTGGYYFVFLGGRPIFRKYDEQGTLLFERHVEGAELDVVLSTLPTRWPTRRAEDREMPFVTPTIRTAAVDPEGRLWISLSLPYTYVYDPHGDKLRTVQFRAAGTISPTSLFFTTDGRLLVTPGCYEFDPR